MTSAARDKDEAPFTAEERAWLRRLRKVLERGLPAEHQVDEQPAPKVARDREPPPEAFERVQRLRRRKGISNG